MYGPSMARARGGPSACPAPVSRQVAGVLDVVVHGSGKPIHAYLNHLTMYGVVDTGDLLPAAQKEPRFAWRGGLVVGGEVLPYPCVFLDVGAVRLQSEAGGFAYVVRDGVEKILVLKTRVSVDVDVRNKIDPLILLSSTAPTPP